jgi:hypothetical protein
MIILTIFSQNLLLQSSSSVDLSEDETFYARVKELDVLMISTISENEFQIKISAEVEYWNWARSNITIRYPNPSPLLLNLKYYGEENITAGIPNHSALAVILEVVYSTGISSEIYETTITIKSTEEMTHVPVGDYRLTPKQSSEDWGPIGLYGANISFSETGAGLTYDPIHENWPEESTEVILPITYTEVISPITSTPPDFSARIIDFKLGEISSYSNEYSTGYRFDLTAKVDYWNKNQEPVKVAYPAMCSIRLEVNYTGAEDVNTMINTGMCRMAVTKEEYPTGLSSKTFNTTVVISTEGESDHIPYGIYHILPEKGWITGGEMGGEMVLYGVNIIISENGITIEYEIPEEWPDTDPVNSYGFIIILPAITVYVIVKRRKKRV